MLKLAIRSLGISDLVVKFDLERRLVLARYFQGGAELTKEITFDEIEELFTQGPIQGQAEPPAAKLPAAGG